MNILSELFKYIEEAGGESYIVGGYARDILMNETSSKDVDIEVYGLEYDDLLQSLSSYKITEAGKSFGVIKLNTKGLDIDIALPRTEISTGPLHTDFDVVINPFITLHEASGRRDFTMNTVMLNPLTDEITCTTSGIHDIHVGNLEVVSRKSFIDDPLRLLRAFQFISRFELTPSEQLMELASENVVLNNISAERLWVEWEKWALSTRPDKGLQFLKDCNKLPPEIKALDNCPQSPLWHPEGDVFVHTCQVVRAAAKFAKDNDLSDKETKILVFAGLCHDFGKPEYTNHDEFNNFGHEYGGEPPTRSFLESIDAPKWLIDNVVPLVKEHLFHGNFRKCEPKAKHIRKLSAKLEPSNIQMWYLLCNADMSGRSITSCIEEVELPEIWIELAKQEKVESNKPNPIVTGKHLIKLGLTPGIEFQTILCDYYEQQLNGELEEINKIIADCADSADSADSGE